MYTKLRHESQYLQNTTFWQNYIRNKKKKKKKHKLILLKWSSITC